MGNVEDTASSRRAQWNLGDVAFSLGTAVLGCALLFAAGQHLFGPTPDGMSQPSAAHTGQVAARAVATALAVPRASNVAVTPAFVRRSTPAEHVPQRARRGRQAPRAPQSPQVAHVRMNDAPHAPPDVPRASRPLGATHALSVLSASHRSGSSSTRDNAGNKVPRKLAVASPLVPASPIAAVSNRLRPASDTAKRIVAPYARPAPAGQSARTAPATRAARPAPAVQAARSTAVARAASVTTRSAPDRVERRKIVARATSVPARTRSVARTPGLANHVRAKRQRAIIEPPLGYEAQPALVVAPAAAALDLGAPALPSIRSRRRH